MRLHPPHTTHKILSSTMKFVGHWWDEFRFLTLSRFMIFKFPFPYMSLDMINMAGIFLILFMHLISCLSQCFYCFERNFENFEKVTLIKENIYWVWLTFSEGQSITILAGTMAACRQTRCCGAEVLYPDLKAARKRLSHTGWSLSTEPQSPSPQWHTFCKNATPILRRPHHLIVSLPMGQAFKHMNL